jgi:hypothetical protein
MHGRTSGSGHAHPQYPSSAGSEGQDLIGGAPVESEQSQLLAMSERTEASPEGREVWLRVDSLAELVEREAEILERIAEVPNGEHLFLIHPFMLLDDVGVTLSERARAELLHREPNLSALSPVPYLALRECEEPQTVHYHLTSLFWGGEQ